MQDNRLIISLNKEQTKELKENGAVILDNDIVITQTKDSYYIPSKLISDVVVEVRLNIEESGM